MGYFNIVWFFLYLVGMDAIVMNVYYLLVLRWDDPVSSLILVHFDLRDPHNPCSSTNSQGTLLVSELGVLRDIL